MKTLGAILGAVILILIIFGFFILKEYIPSELSDGSYIITYGNNNPPAGKLIVYRGIKNIREDYFPSTPAQYYERLYIIGNRAYNCKADNENGPWSCEEMTNILGGPIGQINPYPETSVTAGKTPTDSENILGFDARCFKQVVGINFVLNQTTYETFCLHPDLNIRLKDGLRTATNLSFESIDENIFELP